jgi:Protein of unknown function (DUF3168)
MNDYAAIGSALYGRLGTVQYSYSSNGAGTVTGSLGCYDTLAPQGGTPPYVIFQLQAGRDEYLFGTNSGRSVDYLVKAISDRHYASMQAQGIYATAHDNLQDAPLSISGGYPLRCRRMSDVYYRDTDGYWHVGGIYRIDFWHS